METTIIGFGFKARRGKDTVVNAIIEARGGQFDIRRYAFADALRQEVENAAVCVWEQNHGGQNYEMADPREIALELCDAYNIPFDPSAVVEPLYPFTKQRALYQWWGTEYRRSNDAFYWVNKLRQRIEWERPQFALVTDMRFRNEVSYIRSMEGYTALVDREGYEDKLTTGQQKHASEIELDSAPASIWTRHLVGREGDVDGLKAQGIAMFDGIVKELSFPDLSQLLGQAS